MALAFDAQSTKGGFAATTNWTHTPVGAPRGVVVLISQNTINVDRISGVTYGAVQMARAIGGFASDASGEPGAAYLYHLGTSIPTGPQNVIINVSTGTESKEAWCVTMTAAADTRVATTAAQNGDEANPNVVLGTPSGYTGIVCAVIFSGQNAPSALVPGAGYTALTGTSPGGRDFGSQSGAAMYGAKSGANITANWTATIEDVAMVASAIEEFSVGTATYPPHAFTAVGSP